MWCSSEPVRVHLLASFQRPGSSSPPWPPRITHGPHLLFLCAVVGRSWSRLHAPPCPNALPLCISTVMLPRRTPATNSFLLPSLSCWDMTTQFAATHLWWGKFVFRECVALWPSWFSSGVVSCLTILFYDPPDSPLVWSVVRGFSLAVSKAGREKGRWLVSRTAFNSTILIWAVLLLQ